MSSKVAHYLQEHLIGEVISSTDARQHFAYDSSILQMAPSLVVYPKNENDIRKAARFSWQLAERGRIISLTPRGSGSDQTGAAIGSGMVIVFPAHMNRILELDTKSNTVTVEPGINYGRLQEVLHTHGRFLPPYPPSLDYSTVGGSVANNRSGERSVKYGPTLNFVKSLRLVLANGEVIETKRLNKRELSKKLGLATFEGEIYRSIDTLLEEKGQAIENLERGTLINNAGYNLLDIKHKDGSFDLTPLIVGSQGSLGIITEVVLETENYEPKSTLIVASFDSMEHLQSTVSETRKLSDLPNAFELVDQHALQQIHELNPNHLKDSIKQPFPLFTCFIEFEGDEKATKKSVKPALKILDQYAVHSEVITDPEQQIQQWKIRESVNVLVAHNEGLLHPLPMFDAAVPLDRLRAYIEGIHKIMSTNNLKVALWGHVGMGNLSVRPMLNLGQVGDRQKAFRLLDDFEKMVLDLGGSISATSSEGRLRTPYVEQMYGSEVYGLLYKVKQIFDPYSTLNPGIKFGSTIDDLKAIVRPDYSQRHIYDHLPRA